MPQKVFVKMNGDSTVYVDFRNSLVDWANKNSQSLGSFSDSDPDILTLVEYQHDQLPEYFIVLTFKDSKVATMFMLTFTWLDMVTKTCQ